MVVGEGLELAAVGLAGAPHVAHGLRAVASVGHAVHVVVLGLILWYSAPEPDPVRMLFSKRFLPADTSL